MKKTVIFSVVMLIVINVYPQLIHKTINQNGSGPDNFTTFSAAVNWLNTTYSGTQGVMFEIAGNQTFIEDIPNITFQGSASNIATFECISKSTVIQRQTNSTNYDAIITIEGADYITINGLIISDETQICAERGITIYSPAGANNGCNHITISDCVIILNSNNPNNTYGIFQTINGTPTAASAANNNNSYLGNTIKFATFCGIYLNGNSSFPDQGNIISSFGTTKTVIDNQTYGNSGYGIFVTEQKDFEVSKTIVKNISSINYPEGIHLEKLSGTNTVQYCDVNSVVCYSLTPTTQIAYGMNFILPYACILKVNNNMISNISHKIETESSGLWVRGIGFTSTNSSILASFRFNSVYLNEDNKQSTACFATPSVPMSGVIDIVRNIFANNSDNGSSACSFGMYFGNTSSAYSGEYNDIWVKNMGSNSYIGRINGINYQTLSEFQTATNSEYNSISVSPVFVSNTDLHLNIYYNTDLSDKGGQLPLTEYDFDGDLRSTIACDMGCDEFTPAPPPITLSVSDVKSDEITVHLSPALEGLDITDFAITKDGNPITIISATTTDGGASYVIKSATLSGTCIVSVSKTGSTFSNSPLSFGAPIFDSFSMYYNFVNDTQLGSQRYITITFVNSGNGTLIVNSIVNSGTDADQFYLQNVNVPYFIMYEAPYIIVNFNPTSVGQKNTQIVFTEAGGLEHIMYVSANAIPASIDNINENLINIYPNPFDNFFTIETDNFQKAYIEIVSTSGQVVNSMFLDNNKTQIDVSNLEQGVYFVRISENEKSTTKKIIKK